MLAEAMEILLVGGAVRNLLLGRPAADKDFLVLGATENEFLRRFPDARRVGKTFPVFWLDGSEYAFPRGDSLESDLRARDFTVNAMARRTDGELHSHPLALEDLRAHVLRPAAPDALRDDPIRIFRAARFLAQLPELSPHPELLEAMRGCADAGLTANQLPDRVGMEVRKALRGERPGRFLDLLAETGNLAPWLIELERGRDIPAGPPQHHDDDVVGHTADIMNRCAGQGELVVWMALCHDLGKGLTPPGALPRHHGHDRAGEEEAKRLGARLRLPARLIEAGAVAARWHMVAARYDELRPGTRVDLLTALHAKRLTRELFELVSADAGKDFRERAARDLQTILSVTLPPEQRDLGALSGERLRQLRIGALKHKEKSSEA